MIANMRYHATGAALLAVLVAGTAYEAAVALRWIEIGDVPGEGPAYEGVVLGLALLAMFLGAIWSLVLGSEGRQSIVASLLPLAAAAFVVARYYTFDPYNAPTLIRYSDAGGFSPVWVYGLALAALVAFLVSGMRPRVGFFLGAPVLLLCAFTATFLGFGH
jgi:hypothetical protein